MGLLIMGLATDRDVLKLLTCYRRIAGPHLGQVLDTTVADMRTGNYENALLHFQNLVGSTMLSDIVRGLIETLRGDDQQMYFKMLAFDMRQIEQNNLKEETGKRPKQMQGLPVYSGARLPLGPASAFGCGKLYGHSR